MSARAIEPCWLPVGAGVDLGHELAIGRASGTEFCVSFAPKSPPPRRGTRPESHEDCSADRLGGITEPPARATISCSANTCPSKAVRPLVVSRAEVRGRLPTKALG